MRKTGIPATPVSDLAMRAGKLSETVLGRSVLKQLHTTRAEVLAGPAVGQDAAVFRAGTADVVCAVSAMPLTSDLSAAVAVYTACNNLACGGAAPTGILVSLLLPTAADEQELRDIMGGIEAVCAREQMQVLGGHTGVSRSVAEPVLHVTAIGAVPVGSALTGRAEPGMEIFMAGYAGRTGAVLLSRERERELGERYARPFLEKAKETPCLSVCTAAEAVLESGATLHDVSEGGVYGALWELGERFGVGMEVDLKKIPIRQETIEVCEFFHLNPYKLLSTGALLIATKDGDALAAAGAVPIGRITGGSDRLLFCDGERRFLEAAQADEFYKMKRS